MNRDRHFLGFLRVRRMRRSVHDVAVAARARAGAAEDHERRRAVMPALADVGAVRLLADGVESEPAHQLLEPAIVLRARRAHLQPVGFGLAWSFAELALSRL